jgi:hypothetical protein
MSKRKGAKIKFKLNYFINAYVAITSQSISIIEKIQINHVFNQQALITMITSSQGQI